jgi:multidrug resistance protein, MATE family
VQTAFVIGAAIASAGAIRLGTALGATDHAAARRTITLTYALTLASAASCGLVFALAPDRVAGWYTSDPLVLGLAGPFLAMAALFTVVDQLQVCGLTLLHGAADTVAASIIAAVGYWGVALPLVWWLRAYSGMHLYGLWIGLGAGAAIMSIAGMVRLKSVAVG